MAAPPPPHPLAHLDPCPECGTTFLISPRHCTGEKEPAHEDWWYELCFKKIRPVDPNDECDYFDWCEELGKGKPGEIPYSIGRRCPGLGCQGWRQGRKVNLLCYFGLCKQCCVDAHFTVTGLPACFVKDHNPTRVARAQYAAGPPGPSAQLVALQISERERLDTQNARKADAEEEKKTIEDEEEHELFILVAPYYPRFHPKDCPDLVERFHVDKESFQFFVWPKWDWVTGTPNTPRRDLLSAGGDLYYRSPGVKRAPGMPMRGIRRTLSSFSSDADEGASPAMQRFRSHGWYVDDLYDVPMVPMVQATSS
ncbi:hypothetical protein C8T65DRAFT_691372 [Cerioporus squamosus]|nr:hypothetical protein C8T65DRAFT_691372 [Cerioporus squamosus]